jgi:hypothetical protein
LFKRAKDAGWTGNPHDDGRSLADIFTFKPRPVICLEENENPRVIDQAEEALITADGNLFKFGSILVAIGKDEFITTEGKNRTNVYIKQITRAAMMEHLDRAAIFKRYDKRAEGWVKKSCPPQIADAYMARPEWRIKKLAGIVHTPTLRHDGSILDTPGYDRDTGLYFAPGDTHFLPVPDKPTKADATAALEILKGLIKTFPFLDEPSRSVALAGFLSTLFRRSIENCPLIAFTAPVKGSGKTLLVDVAAMLATGNPAPIISQAGSEELEKRIGSELIAGAPVINVDNISRPLEGDLLNSLLTQSTLHVRILGQSKSATVSGNVMLFCTGNNLVIKGDLTRRALLCSIDPEVERPELREFEEDCHPLKLLQTNRGKYVLAGLTILRAFFVADRPKQSKPLGSFEEWSRTVRDALLWLGCADPVTSMDRLQEFDPVRDAQGALHSAWKDTLGFQKVSVHQLINAATGIQTDPQKMEDRMVLHDALAAVCGKGPRNELDAQALGFYLNSHQGRIINGLCFKRMGVSRKRTTYQLFSATTPAAANDDGEEYWANYRVGD